MHKSALLNETLQLLDLRPGHFVIDGTINGGGHAKEILEQISPGGMLLGIDLDPDAIKLCQKEFENQKSKIILVNNNFKKLPQILQEKNLPKADRLLLDLGFSSNQIEKSGRGLSFQRDEPLDMRYNPEDPGIESAREIVNTFPENQIADILWRYGEERYSRRIAKKIIEARKRRPISTTAELVSIIHSATPYRYHHKPIHYSTRSFMALRIFINRELDNLKTVLDGLAKILKPKGRSVVISFHSLEDRIVKNKYRNLAKEGIVEILTKKPITASEQEISENFRSRSAKLRACSIISNPKS